MGKKYIIELEDKPFHKGNGDFLYRVKGFNSLVFDMTGIGMLTPYTEPDLERVRKEAYEDGYKTAKVQCNIQAEKDLREVGKRHYQKGLSDAWEAARRIVNLKVYERIRLFNGNTYWTIIDNHTASEAIEKLKAYEQEQDEIQISAEPIPVEDLTPYTEPDLEKIRNAYDKGFEDGKELCPVPEVCYNNAYQKGLSDAEEGKATCQYCEYEYLDDTEEPCKKCCKAYMNKYKPKANGEQIHVGDEVISRNKTAVVTEITDRYVRIMYSDGSCYALFSKGIVKTGRNFPEIAAVLEKMREGQKQ